MCVRVVLGGGGGGGGNIWVGGGGCKKIFDSTEDVLPNPNPTLIVNDSFQIGIQIFHINLDYTSY